jgi:hypothetical protein
LGFEEVPDEGGNWSAGGRLFVFFVFVFFFRLFFSADGLLRNNINKKQHGQGFVVGRYTDAA